MMLYRQSTTTSLSAGATGTGDMSLTARLRKVPATLIEWLQSSPDQIPVDLREFRESQKRLYEQSAELNLRTDEFGKMVRRMTSARRGKERRMAK